MIQSKRTGGPKTEAGKMSSAKNAIKTGAYSTLIILPGENEKDFQELEEQFISDFNPEDIVAATMVHNLTVLTWKKLRAQKIEHSGLVRALTAKFEITDYLRISFPSAISDAGPVLTVVDAISQAEEAEWIAAFAFCNKFIKGVPSEQELKDLKLSSPLLYAHLEAKAVAGGRQDCSFWPNLTVTTLGGKVLSFINYYCESFLKDYQVAKLAVENIVRLRQIVKEIKEARLLKFMQEKSIQRVHDDLDRAFYRTLSELRKHQHWRQERNTVDVTSED
jgi:hypothetical protein